MRIASPLLTTIRNVIDNLERQRIPYNYVDSNPVIDVSSGVGSGVEGAKVQIHGVVAEQKHLVGIVFNKLVADAAVDAYLTFYKGAAGVEQFYVSMAVPLGQTGITTFWIPVGLDTPYNQRFSVTVKDENAGALTYTLGCIITQPAQSVSST